MIPNPPIIPLRSLRLLVDSLIFKACRDQSKSIVTQPTPAIMLAIFSFPFVTGSSKIVARYPTKTPVHLAQTGI